MRRLWWILLAVVGPGAFAQHSHINAGARAATEGSQLFFANGSRFEVDSGFLVHLEPTNSATYGSIYFGGSGVTFTGLPSTLDNGGPAAFAALPGSHLVMVFETVDGPPGGAFSVWDSVDGFFDATEITFTLASWTRGGTNQMALSENDGSAGVDPYGHIHGRKFSVSKPGLYTVGVRLVDTATNGTNGIPLHAPSDLAYFQFQAGDTIAGVTPSEEGVRIRFGTQTGRNYFVEASETMSAGAAWNTVAGPIAGDDLLQTTEHLKGLGRTAFFRLRVE